VRYGGLDGKGITYKVVSKPDFQGFTIIFAGDIQLEPGEDLIAAIPDSRFGIVKGWRRISAAGIPHTYTVPRASRAPRRLGVALFADKAPGSYYVTDRRLVFLRRPDLREIRRFYDSPDGGPPLGVMTWAGAVIQSDSLEYCEIRFEDIVKYVEGREGASIYIDLGVDRYRVWLERRVWDIIAPILKKRLMVNGPDGVG